MYEIQQWVRMICVLCVLYCLLESILPEKEPFPVIKLACVLYILIALISPSKDFSFDEINFEIDTQPVATVNQAQYQDIVLSQTQTNLQNQLFSYLETTGYKLKEISITLGLSDEDLAEVEEVYIICNEGEDIQGMKNSVVDFFMVSVNVIIKEE